MSKRTGSASHRKAAPKVAAMMSAVALATSVPGRTEPSRSPFRRLAVHLPRAVRQLAVHPFAQWRGRFERFEVRHEHGAQHAGVLGVDVADPVEMSQHLLQPRRRGSGSGLSVLMYSSTKSSRMASLLP